MPVRRIIALAAAFATVLSGPAETAVAAVYTWTDADGKKHYSDAPPPGGKAKEVKLRIGSIATPRTVLRTSPGPVTGKLPVKLYSATWCGYCKLARAHLQRRAIPFAEHDVETSETGAREYRSLGASGVPIVLVGPHRMDGYGPEDLDAMLASGGYGRR